MGICCRSPCSTCTVGSAICSALSLGSPQPSELKQSLRQAHRTARGGRDIYCAGETTADAHIICDGWAARVSEMPDGRRQIVSFLLPGDLLGHRFSRRDHGSFGRGHLELRYSLVSRTNLLAALSKQSGLFEIWGKLHVPEMQAAQRSIMSLGQHTPDARNRGIGHRPGNLVQHSTTDDLAAAIRIGVIDATVYYGERVRV